LIPAVIKANIKKSWISPFNRNAITPEARAPSTVSANQNENSHKDDSILYTVMYHCQSPHCVPIVNHESDSSCSHCTVVCHSILSAVNFAGDPGNIILTRQERTMIITVLAYLLYMQMDLKKSTEAKWIQCCFCLL
jgi:hypothetical protein